MKAIFLLAFLFFVFSLPLFANSSFKKTIEISSHVETKIERIKKFEIGVAGGFPVIGSAVVGYWGDSSFPVLARLSIGIGMQTDLGMQLHSEPEYKTYLALSGGVLGIVGLIQGSYVFVGPTLGLNYKGFWIQGGPHVGAFSGGNSVLTIQSVPIFFHAQVGFSLFL